MKLYRLISGKKQRRWRWDENYLTDAVSGKQIRDINAVLFFYRGIMPTFTTKHNSRKCPRCRQNKIKQTSHGQTIQR